MAALPRFRILSLISLLLFFALPLPLQGQVPPGADPWAAADPEIDWPRWNRDHGGLTDISSWFVRVRTGGAQDDRRHKGALGVGNGHAFGLIGLSSPVNTLFNHAGPTYQQPQNFFGELSLHLTQAGALRPFAEEWAYRFRGTGVVGSRGEASQGLSLSTVDLAPRSEDGAPAAILRIIVVQNGGGGVAEDVGVRASLYYDRDEAPRAEGGRLVQLRGDRRCDVGLLPGQGGVASTIDGGDLTLSLGDLAPGEERVVVLGLAYTLGTEGAGAGEMLTALGATWEDALAQTLSAWREDLALGAQLRSPAPRLDDLYEGMIAAILTQRSSDGAISPMDRYTKAWLRDTIGPLRLFARTGRSEDALAMLAYLYEAARYYGELRNSYALALPIAALPPLDDAAAFWAQAPLMPGRNAAEAPSYLPLQYLTLYRHLGPGPWLAERYAYLQRAMEGQAVEADGRMPFSGDETFRVPLSMALSLPRDPTDAAWSANSGFAYVAGMDALATLAEGLGADEDAAAYRRRAAEVRAQTEALYRLPGGSYGPVRFFKGDALHPHPYEDVSTKPLFFGYADPDAAQTKGDVDALVSALMRPNGTLLTPDGAFGRMENPIYTGMVPGLFLSNVAQVDHPAAPLAFDALAGTASPSGMWQEMHWKDGTAAVATYSPSGRGASEVAARYRPWEGGENIDGMVLYLTGAGLDVPGGRLSLAPRLPLWLETFTFEGLPLGPGGRYDLAVSRDGPTGGSGTWRIALSPSGEGALTLDLSLLEPGALWGDARVDGIPWGDLRLDAPYPGQDRLTLEGIPLKAGRPLVVEVDFTL